jgi:hypothetical protein
MVKGQCREISDTRFYKKKIKQSPKGHDSGLKHMGWYSPRYSIQLFAKFGFRSLSETAGSVSAVSMRLRDGFLLFQWDHGICLGHFCKVSIRPWKWSQQCHWNHRIRSRSLNETAEILWYDLNLCKNDQSWLSFPLKGSQINGETSHTYS